MFSNLIVSLFATFSFCAVIGLVFNVIVKVADDEYMMEKFLETWNKEHE